MIKFDALIQDLVRCVTRLRWLIGTDCSIPSPQSGSLLLNTIHHGAGIRVLPINEKLQFCCGLAFDLQSDRGQHPLQDAVPEHETMKQRRKGMRANQPQQPIAANVM